MATGFNTIGSALPWIEKRPGALLDYVIDFSDDLAAGETLSSASVSVEAGITLGSSPAPYVNSSTLTVRLKDDTTKTIAAGKAVVLWLSGGTLGERYDVTVTCPQGGRILPRTFEVRMVK